MPAVIALLIPRFPEDTFSDLLMLAVANFAAVIVPSVILASVTAPVASFAVVTSPSTIAALSTALLAKAAASTALGASLALVTASSTILAVVTASLASEPAANVPDNFATVTAPSAI